MNTDFLLGFASGKAASGGGSSVDVEPLSVTQNGQYTAESGKAYSPVNVSVPNSYAAADEGKVVHNGALVGQTSKNINANGTVDTTTNNEVVVAVPNSYTAGDEGKVVSNGALVAQTSDTVTQNGTVDTTLINSLLVNVSGGGGGASNVVTGTFTGSARGAMDVSLNYSGTGYPVAFVAYPKSGAYDPSSDFYNLVARYAIEYILLVKNVRSDVPAWDSSFTGGMFTYNVRYKNSTSSETTYNNNSRTDAKTLGNKDATTGGSGEITVRFKSSTVMSVYITNRDSYTVAEYGFYHGIEYEYCVIYSE